MRALDSPDAAPAEHALAPSKPFAAPVAIADATPRVLWSVAPEPGVSSYQWWVLTGGRWTLAQDWTPSTTFSRPFDGAAGVPLVGVVMR